MFEIAQGESVRIDGRLYKFQHRARNGNFCFMDPEQGNPAELTEENVLAKFAKGEIKLRVSENLAIDPRNLDFASVREEHRKEAEERLTYIKAIYAAGNPGSMAKTWPSILAGVATVLRHEAAPQWTTVRRWMRKYEKADGDIRSLLPNYGGRGRLNDDRSTEERKFLNELILNLYMVKSRPTVKWLYGQIEAKYREIQKTRPDAYLWKVPSRSTVYRRINRIDGYELDRARYGKRAADHKYRAIGRGKQASYRLEVVEIDHTKANVFIIDEVHKALIGRPTITIAIDRFTRMIVGLYIGFEPPSTFSVMQCLRNMILPKTYVATEFPKIGLAWKAYGIPVSVVVDNAFEFTSNAFRDVAAVLNFDISQQPVRQPEFKGIVERFMRTIEQKAMAGMPGRTFSNPKEKGDYEGMACITLREFREFFHHWMLADYCYQFHEGIIDVPAKRWDDEVKREPVRLPKDVADIDMYLGITKEGTLRREGVRFANLFYNSPELNQVLRTIGSDRTVKFTVNPDDLSEIMVIHPERNVPIRAFCTYREYSSGLTLYQHTVIQTIRRKQGKAFANQADFVAARDAFYKASEQLLLRANTRQRSRLARNQGGQNVQQPATESDIEAVKSLMMGSGDPDLAALLSEASASIEPHQSQATGKPSNTTGAIDDQSNYAPDAAPDCDDLLDLAFRDRGSTSSINNPSNPTA